MKAILYLTVKGPVGWEDLYKEITLPFTPYPGLVLTTRFILDLEPFHCIDRKEYEETLDELLELGWQSY